MPRNIIDIYMDELQFLINLKQSIGILNNRIHDKLSLIAIEKLRSMHPNLRFEYGGAGAGGIDIRGYAPNKSLKLVAEVKSTYTSDKVKIRGPQKDGIRKDLQRLSAVPKRVKRYLIVISEQTKNAVETQLNTKADYPSIKVIDALGSLQLVPTDDNE